MKLHFTFRAGLCGLMLSVVSCAEKSEPIGPDVHPEFQWKANVIVGQAQANNITVDLSHAANPNWAAAARAAMVEWNRANCSNVRMSEATPGQIRIEGFWDQNYTHLYIADYPATAPAGSGLPGPRIATNNNGVYPSPNTPLSWKRTMARLLGAAMGIRSTDWNQVPGEYKDPLGATLVPGTPNSDAISVFNAQKTEEWRGFDTYDLIAIRSLWPNTNPAVCVTGSLAGPSNAWPYSTCTWTANATGGVPPYQYSWMGGAYTSGRTFMYRTLGSSFEMQVSVLDANGRRSDVSKTVNVYQYGPGPCA